jgi:hypothetical protein
MSALIERLIDPSYRSESQHRANRLRMDNIMIETACRELQGETVF